MGLEDIKSVMEQIGEISPELSAKEKSKAAVAVFEEIASQRGISLKLRK